MRTLSSIEELDFAAARRTPIMVAPLSDHALLQGTLEGDHDAFAELVGRYRNQITSYIYPAESGFDNGRQAFPGKRSGGAGKPNGCNYLNWDEANGSADIYSRRRQSK